MSASISNATNPTIAVSPNAAAANNSSSGSSANVAAGSAQPTARSSYANATQKNSSPTIASSGAPPAVGGPQSAQHGKSSSVSPVNGSTSIKPAIPSMPAIVGGNPNGNGDHSRKSSVHIKQGPPPTVSGPPSTLKFGSLAGSPAPAHASPAVLGNLSTQSPRVASPTHSPSPIPTPISGGPKPESLPTRPNLVFGGQGGEGTDASSRPMNMPPQHNNLPQAQHLRRESSQSAHSDMSNANMNRGFPPNGRGRGGFAPQYNQPSPQPYRAHPQMGGRGGMPPTFTPQSMQQNSPYRQNRSPAIAPAHLHQQQQYANPPQAYYPNQHYQQPPNMYAMSQPYDPQGMYQMNQMGYGLQQSIHYPGGPASPAFRPQQMQPGYGQPPYGAQGMSRTPSNMSERPSSAVPAPSTPAMTNVNHINHSHTPSVTAASPAPSSTFERPKKQSKAIVIKTADGEVVDFKKPKGAASPAPAAALAPPAQPPRSPAIAATPTPPPRVPSATEEKTAEEKKSEFVRQFQEKIRLQEESEKQAKDTSDASLKAEAEAKQKAEEEAKQKTEEEAKAKAEQEAKDKAAADAEIDAAEKTRLDEEEFDRMVAELEAEEAKREAEEKAFAEKREKQKEAEKANAAQRIKEEEERLRKLEREAEEAELARENMTPEQKAAKAEEDKAMFASLAKNTTLGPMANMANVAQEEPAAEEPPAPAPAPAAKPTSAKSKPSALKLDTQKPVEPAQPTAGMQSLKSARFLQVREDIAYPSSIASPNPSLNAGSRRGKTYDKAFLLQFQDVFKEKPSTDWDLKLKETVGDGTDSARPQSARGGPMSSRQPSSRGMGPGNAMGAMGAFQGASGGRTLPPNTTSQQRFEAASGRSMTNPLAHVVMGGGRGGQGQFPMGAPMARNQSYSNLPSPRNASQRGKGGSRRGGPPNKNEQQEAKAMPLTAGQAVKDLERSQTGWKPQSITGNPGQQPTAGHMPPDMVQRKVKAALNKMTPEKFDKISDQILEIAAQSKDETDGRTLRQVIQLTFEKACDESHWSSMYAKFCARMLATMSTEIKDENVRDKHGNPVVGGSLFRKYLLNRCQEEFERGWEVNLPTQSPEAIAKGDFSDDYYIAAAAKRKGLGLIQFIGELYKLGMLTLRIMHECVLKLLDFEGQPDESAIESLVKLLRTVGSTMESAEAGPKMINMYFERIEKVMNMEGLPSRQKFMLLDTIDMRKNGWKSKDILKGPKTIAEIHQEALAAQQAAEMERTRSNQRGGGGGGRLPMGRGDARSFSGGGMMPPPDTGSRVQMDDLRKLSKGATGRNMNTGAALGPSMLGSRSGSGRRGLGPGMMGGRDDSGNSSRTGTPPVQKEKESTAHANAFSALAALENADDTGDVSSPPPAAEDTTASAESKPSE